MDVIKKFLIMDGSALVTVADTRALTERARKLHDLSPLATAALGRTLTVAAFMSLKFKDKAAHLSITVDGGGPIGKITVCAGYGAQVRGFVENPHVDLPLNAHGKLDVGGAVGHAGNIRCVTDLRLKEPYMGQSQLVTGEISEDFAYYFTVSEQQPSAVAAGVLVNGKGVKAAGGVFIQPLPGCDDYKLTMLEDIATNFVNVSCLIDEHGVDGIIENYFSHLGMSDTEILFPRYKCVCGKRKIDALVNSLPEKEKAEILDERGEIEVVCHFCNKVYRYGREDVEDLKAKHKKK
ncbi:MAG: Hsp33 family molecular chaperone HslO [Clostridiaceae bacterium]|jgi:molecular chaperone Hsp33|nr:Hsp33 family molecular chaperone HslO [Clostridiaceae bacterium]